MDCFLTLKDISKKFSKFYLKNINFSLQNGQIMGLIGRNGAGKTTIIKLILNMIKADSGEVKILGKHPIENEILIKQNIGVVFDSNYFVDSWTIKEVEKLFKIFYNTWDSNKFKCLCERFNLLENKKVRDLSKGMQMKLMVACSLSYNPKLLILDEPTSGLDPVSRDELLDIIKEYVKDKNHSVLFSTHITSDLDKVADTITYIKNGNLLYSGEKNDFLDSYKIIIGDIAILKDKFKNNLIGIKKVNDNYEALLETKYVKAFPNITYKTPSIDDIIIHTNKGEMTY